MFSKQKIKIYKTVGGTKEYMGCLCFPSRKVFDRNRKVVGKFVYYREETYDEDGTINVSTIKEWPDGYGWDGDTIVKIDGNKTSELGAVGHYLYTQRDHAGNIQYVKHYPHCLCSPFYGAVIPCCHGTDRKNVTSTNSTVSYPEGTTDESYRGIQNGQGETVGRFTSFGNYTSKEELSVYAAGAAVILMPELMTPPDKQPKAITARVANEFSSSSPECKTNEELFSKITNPAPSGKQIFKAVFTGILYLLLMLLLYPPIARFFLENTQNVHSGTWGLIESFAEADLAPVLWLIISGIHTIRTLHKIITADEDYYSFWYWGFKNVWFAIKTGIIVIVSCLLLIILYTTFFSTVLS